MNTQLTHCGAFSRIHVLLSVALGFLLIVGSGAFFISEAQAQQKRPVGKAGTGPKKVYCWEEQGRKVCGDALPATQADQARTEINAKTGMTRRQVERAQTPEERAAAALLAQQQAELIRQQQDHQNHINNLLGNFANEEELAGSYNEKIATVENSIRLAQDSIKRLRDSLLSELEFLGNAELANKPLAPKRVENVTALRKQILDQQQAIARYNQTILDYKNQQQQSLALYRQAKGLAPLQPSPY